jgi:flagellar motor switch protein FliN/FliY
MTAGLSQAEIDALFASMAAADPNKPKAQAQPQPQPQPEPQPVTFPSLERAPASQGEAVAIGMLGGVELEVAVHLGKTRRSIREILALGPGSVLELDKLAGESVDILVNGRLVARGEVVVIGENFGVRIAELIQPSGGTAK